MGLKNRVKEFLQERGLSAYKLIKDTGISSTTGYALAKNPDHLPSVIVLQIICDRYQVQPADIIYWVKSDDDQTN